MTTTELEPADTVADARPPRGPAGAGRHRSRAMGLLVLLTLAVAIALSISPSTGRPTPPAPRSPERFLGYWTAYGSDVAQLEPGEAYGWGPSWDDDAASVGTIRPDYQSIDVRRASMQIASEAHTEGAKYVYKPLLDNRGIAPTSTWFTSYLDDVLLPVVTGDPATEPDLIDLETELDGAIGPNYDADWRTLIFQLRAAGYRGKLLGTSSNRYIAGWWDAVDYVGGDFYPPIDTSSEQAATASWEAQVGWQVTAYHAGSGKPVLFGEIGSYQGTMTAEQWDAYLNGLFIAMRRHPAWAGGLFWAGYEGFLRAAPEPQTATAPPVPSASGLARAAGLSCPPGPLTEEVDRWSEGCGSSGAGAGTRSGH